jgi:hypothetical protein
VTRVLLVLLLRVFDNICGVGNARDIDEFGRSVSDSLTVDNSGAVGTGHLPFGFVRGLSTGGRGGSRRRRVAGHGAFAIIRRA